MLEQLMQEDAREIVQTLLQLAKAGDVRAALAVLDRVAPPARSRSIALTLPPTDTPEGVCEAAGAVLAAVAGGELTPGEGSAVSALVEARRRAIETYDLATRVEAIEAKVKP